MATKKVASKTGTKGNLVITAARFEVAEFRILGTAPYVQHKFSEKARREILANQQKTKGSSRKKTEPRNLDAEFEAAMHIGDDGKHGIPAAAFRSAMIEACRAAGFVMTKAKMSVFIEADTFDRDEGTPLVHIKGKPTLSEAAVRLESGVASIAIRPMWRKWEAIVRCRYDADQFSTQDVYNLLNRAGCQVGVGEGRPFSKKSHGMGWGTFDVDEEYEVEIRPFSKDPKLQEVTGGKAA